MSLLKEFTGIPVSPKKPDLKKVDASDAGTWDTAGKAKADDISFSLMRNTINSNGEITGSDIADYLERAADLNDEVDTVPFGLETDDGDIVKVYVNAEEADKFEEAMKKLLGVEDDVEEAINKLALDFDIVDVVWPRDKSEDGDEVDLDASGDFDRLEDEDNEMDVVGEYDPLSSMSEGISLSEPDVKNLAVGDIVKYTRVRDGKEDQSTVRKMSGDHIGLQNGSTIQGVAITQIVKAKAVKSIDEGKARKTMLHRRGLMEIYKQGKEVFVSYAGTMRSTEKGSIAPLFDEIMGKGSYSKMFSMSDYVKSNRSSSGYENDPAYSWVRVLPGSKWDELFPKKVAEALDDPKAPTPEEAAAYSKLMNVVMNLDSMGPSGVQAATGFDRKDHTKLEMITKYIREKHAIDSKLAREWLMRAGDATHDINNLPYWLKEQLESFEVEPLGEIK